MESLIRIAISEYEKNTCLLFVEDIAQSFPQRISFVRIDSGCRCYVGRQNRGHTGCFLSADCDVSSVMYAICRWKVLFKEFIRNEYVEII